MRRLAFVALVIFVVIGATLVLLPFDRPDPHASFTYGPGISSRCSSPVMSAWHGDRPSGSFAYMSLTPAAPASLPSCAGAARHRLAWASAAFGAVVLLAFGLRRRRRAGGGAVPPTVA